MRKAGLITAIAVSAALLGSCSCSSPASGGYFGLSSHKANVKKHKEFQKPKHNSIKRGSTRAKH